MQATLLLAAPFIVSLISQGVKKWVLPWVIQQATIHNGWVVLSVAIVSYIGAILQASLNNGSLDVVSTQTFVMAFINFFGATGVFHLGSNVSKAFGRTN